MNAYPLAVIAAPGYASRLHRADQEQSLYVDRGCEVSPRCTECPLPTCVYDQPRRGGMSQSARDRMNARRREIRRLRASGLTVAEVVERLGVSKRTVQRAR